MGIAWQSPYAANRRRKCGTPVSSEAVHERLTSDLGDLPLTVAAGIIVGTAIVQFLDVAVFCWPIMLTLIAGVLTGLTSGTSRQPVPIPAAGHGPVRCPVCVAHSRRSPACLPGGSLREIGTSRRFPGLGICQLARPRGGTGRQRARPQI